jgi:hypothetical protein
MQTAKALIGAIVCLAPLHALAQESSETAPWDPWEKGYISAGVFWADTDNSVRLGTPGVGIEFDVEDALDLENSQAVFRVDGGYRFGANNRHRIDFSWFDLSRDATKALEADVSLPDGTILPIGTTVRSQFDLAFYNVRYSYSFIKDDRIDFAGSLGLHVTKLGLFLEEVGGGDAGGDSVTAPLPVIGGRLDVALTPKWYLRSSMELFYLEFDTFKGSLADTLLSAEYRAWKHFSLGLGLNSVRINVENNESLGLGFDGKLRSDFVGLMLFGRVIF